MITKITKFKLLIVPEYACVKYSNIGNVQSGHVIVLFYFMAIH